LTSTALTSTALTGPVPAGTVLPGTALPGTALPGKAADAAGARRGRPPGTSRRELELIALRLFTGQGFDNTTIEQIAAEAGVSKRTFFRYFSSKAGVLWSEFDHEVETIRAALADVPAAVPMMDAIRRAVVTANHYGPQDVPELRMRMNLVGGVPALQSSAAVHYDAWERAISDFAATRLGQPADSLYPLAVGRATLAACRAAYDRWSARADAELTYYLDAALAALAAGFEPAAVRASTQALGEHVSGRAAT
jgi:TetR/AcrR family transcriptional regulator, regulator of mycofactocin system